MIIAIVGVGTIGSLHATHLREAGHTVLTMDPYQPSDLTGLQQMHRERAAAVDAWIVASPTDTHLDNLRQILDIRPAARVLLEKPSVSLGQLDDLTELLGAHPEASVAVNNVYGYGEPVAALAEAVRRRSGAGDPIRQVTVEFTKNRRADVDAGRFVDLHYGEVGYEWFHLLAVLRRILPRPEYQAFLDSAPEQVTSEIRVRGIGASFPDINLYASMHGVIGFPNLAIRDFASPMARHHLHDALIPYGYALRYRVAHVEFASGAWVRLVFEPGFGVSNDYKNVHTVREGDHIGAPGHVTEVRGNQLKGAVLTQLELLVAGPSGFRPEVYHAEHEYMASLTRHLHQQAQSIHSSAVPRALARVARST
ncbi:Gfo/Idh/MocA family oxidoreductase [Actinoplanes derwentensis]|uniref:Predicted dehydrogenase n=1 Tax=Actinoplanes derwentensis TaxID=113562 RepID=A0A1H2CC59_9ACTN|nr:Gfo/Idh/MocA family oxidoreductase [Actinoplanes derwentensis]GID87318.1 hypothetical protein Ade03nite_62420 [Actinoplanes derwentensis]SDT68135.1 Predicted dehydrogenase [Actinoplanes derwentensis]